MRLAVCFSIAAWFAAAACGQAVVEHSVATAGASAAAAGAKGAGSSIGSVFRSLTETIDKAGNGDKAGNKAVATSKPAQSAQPAEGAKPAPVSKPIDPSQITEGLTRSELIERFGKPLLRLSEMSNSRVVERLWYNTFTDDQVEIRLIGGKVASIDPPVEKKQEAKN